MFDGGFVERTRQLSEHKATRRGSDRAAVTSEYRSIRMKLQNVRSARCFALSKR